MLFQVEHSLVHAYFPRIVALVRHQPFLPADFVVEVITVGSLSPGQMLQALDIHIGGGATIFMRVWFCNQARIVGIGVVRCMSANPRIQGRRYLQGLVCRF